MKSGGGVIEGDIDIMLDQRPREESCSVNTEKNGNKTIYDLNIYDVNM